MSAAKDPLDPISLTPPAVDGGEEMSRSPLLILFGLVVVWGSLYLVAIAQNISYAPPPAPSVATATPTATFEPPLPGQTPPAGSMLATVESVSLKEVPARQVVKDLLYKAHLHIQPEELDKIGTQATDLHVEGRPLYECLYSALGDVGLGWLVLDNEVRLIEQQVTHQFPDSGQLEQFHWEAEVDVYPRAVSMFPTGRSEYWVKLWLAPGDVGEGGARPLAFEIHRGGTREASGEALLPAPGAGAIRFIPGQRLSLRVENRTPAPAEGEEAVPAVRVAVRLQVQSLTAAPLDEEASEEPVGPTLEPTSEGPAGEPKEEPAGAVSES